LSVKKSQLRFSVKGTKGSFEKKGLDPQEDQLKARKPSPLDPEFGREAEAIFGTLDTLTENGAIQSQTSVCCVGSSDSRPKKLMNADLQGDFRERILQPFIRELGECDHLRGRPAGEV
jgi:hypothetical protein